MNHKPSARQGALALALAVLAAPALCRAQVVITTVAGDGNAGFVGDGGPATNAIFGLLAQGVAVDRAGNLYIADINNNRVRKVDTNGIITTFAGNGSSGFSGDGGPAVSASINNPIAVAADGAGNVYIADLANQRIRKVDTSGIITTFAGNGSLGASGDHGPATSATLSGPSGVAVDSAGNVYIADTSNDLIRKVDTNGIITTVAGGAPLPGFSGDGGPAVGAGLFLPYGVAVDFAGNIYIADVANVRIRKVNTAGIISTVAGNGTRGFSGDGGLATNAEIWPISHQGLAVDSLGNLYIADTSNNRIRVVNTLGVINTIAGNGAAAFSGDGGLPASASLNRPADVAFDASGNLYILDAGNGRIRKITGLTGGSGNGAPVISAVVNGASFQPGVVSNSWATIQGSNLSSVTDNWANSIVNGRLPTMLDGVHVTIGFAPAYIYYISPTQINLIVPPDLPPGPLPVTVTNSAGASAAFTVTCYAYQPAFFSWPSSQVVAAYQDFTFAAQAGTFAGVATTPAKPGDVLILWGTGFGPTIPAVPPGTVVPTLPGSMTYATSTLPMVTIGNVPATVYGAAFAPGYAGLYQVAIQVPTLLSDGNWPVVVTIGGVSSPTGMVLTVKH